MASGSARWGRRWTALVAVGVLVAGGVVVGVISNDPKEDTAPPAGALPAEEFPEPGVEHVHGLGVDPADGALFAATHFGLFRVPEQGPAVRVANRYQDTMGFTVVGPGQFLGSGHPDPREDNPPLLGLIGSDDAGVTWQSLSLRGEADFHVLRAAHGKIYGFDSTSASLLVSEDRKTWDRRSSLPIRDFAVSPENPEALLATGEQGLLRSSDGGRTWTRLNGAPPLVVLGWASDQLVGAASDGSVHSSPDRGATWAAAGSAGAEPQALAVDVRNGVATVFVAAEGGRILASTDSGKSFAVRYRETSASSG